MKPSLPPSFKRIPYHAHGVAFRIFYGVSMGIYPKADEALRTLLDSLTLEEFSLQQRGLAAMLVNETCRWQHTLATIIKQLTGKRLKDIRAPLRQLLLIGLCSLLHPEERQNNRAHHHGNTWVEVAKAMNVPSAQQGLLNACLRQAAELPTLGTENPELEATLNPVAYQAFRWGWPLWAMELLYASRPFNNIAPWLEGLGHHRPLTLFHTRFSTQEEMEPIVSSLLASGITCNPHPNTQFPQALQLKSFPKGGLNALPGFTEGEWVIQDVGSAWVAKHAVEQMQTIQAKTVVDFCAAPGSKTWWMAGTLPVEGTLHAVELSAERLTRLEENLTRLHLKHSVELHQADARYFHLPLNQKADFILVDAPCSGLGTLSHHPDLWLNRSPSQLATYPPLQLAMLQQATQLAHANTRIIYSTCTWNPAENEGVVQTFLEQHVGWECTLEESFAPTQHNDGFYLAVLKPLAF
jgi:16S rRNA (cytosine967-C5)-methyltransferase